MRIRPVMVRMASGVFVAGVVACGSAAGPEFGRQPALDQEMVLQVGQTVEIEGADGLELTFREVTGDSRCPSDALILCVWAGDAVVSVRAAQLPAAPADLELHSNAQFDMVAEYGAFQIQLVGVDPYPATTDPIPVEEYRLTLVVGKK